MQNHFSVEKNNCLTKLDKSNKGSVDEAIIDLIELINHLDDYFTTSSCSGRICIVCKNNLIQKEGTLFVHMTHEPIVNVDTIWSLIVEQNESDLMLKFEACLIHICCRDLSTAQAMFNIALNSGFKNSGISVGKKNRPIVAIRSTLSLEVPFKSDNKLMISREYFDFLIDCANQKMHLNQLRIDRLRENLVKKFVNNIK